MNEKFIRSPLNYTGGKFKILPQIIPLFPKNIDTFLDLFGGGANVSVNVEANKIIYNDSLTQVVEFLRYCKEKPSNMILEELENIVSKYNLNKENVEGYYELRGDYNLCEKSPMLFYALICHSFNNQIRFNKKQEFNLPFGRRSSLNPKLKHDFIDFLNIIKEKNISFYCSDFRKIHLDKLKDDDFVFLDPPYLISTATYNEQNGWNEKDERELLDILDILNSMKVKFGLTNVIENKGLENKILKEWMEKYNVVFLKNDFKNSNHQRIKTDKTIEVFVTNY